MDPERLYDPHLEGTAPITSASIYLDALTALNAAVETAHTGACPALGYARSAVDLF